jgi:Spy/CpxP family protein refolding chaperone
MKRTLKMSRLAFCTVLLACAAVGALVAQPPAPGPPHGGGPGLDEPPFLLERMTEELELSAGQVGEIEGLLETHRIETAGLKAEAKVAHDNLRELVEGDQFDETAVRAAAERAAGLHVELTVERARLRSAIGGILTPEQRERAAELRSERRERWQHFGGRRGSGHGRAPRPGG